jgi:hypothetical protein
LVLFLRHLAGAVAGSAGDAIAVGLPGLLRAAFREAAATGRVAIGGSTEDHIQAVAVGQLAIRDALVGAGSATVDLVAPRDLHRADKPVIRKGAPNGSIELELLWDVP